MKNGHEWSRKHISSPRPLSHPISTRLGQCIATDSGDCVSTARDFSCGFFFTVRLGDFGLEIVALMVLRCSLLLLIYYVKSNDFKMRFKNILLIINEKQYHITYSIVIMPERIKSAYGSYNIIYVYLLISISMIGIGGKTVLPRNIMS